MAKFKIGDKVCFQFGVIYCKGKITDFITPLRATILVTEIMVDGETEITNATYEIDIKELFLTDDIED